MAKYKNYSYEQGRLISVHFDKQILPGTFEYSLSYLIDHEIDLSIFDSRYSNDDTGAPAYDPAILLKIIMFAYSRGIVSSRKIGVPAPALPARHYRTGRACLAADPAHSPRSVRWSRL